MPPTLEAVEYDDAAELIAELDADLAVRYGSDDDPVLAHPEEFESPDGRFFVVTDVAPHSAVRASGGSRLVPRS